MICPSCNSKNTRVIDSRVSQDGTSIRRRRECEKCNFRFTTYEKIAFLSLVVIKRDGTREQFDREKLLEGIKKAFSKTLVEDQIIENIVTKIESELSVLESQEVSSIKIGELTLKFIKEVDPVAYIRYASVFGGVESISDFEEILSVAKKANKTDQDQNSKSSKTELDIKTPAFIRDNVQEVPIKKPQPEDKKDSKITQSSKDQRINPKKQSLF
ncbi:MAG: hypothetical protein Fur0024_3900 [Patescibacteria group bacterium]